MVRIVTFFLLLVNGLTFAQSEQPHTLKAMSFNIRMNTVKDGVNQWSNRKEWVSKLVQFNDIDVVGMQEVLHSQLVDLQESLIAYNSVGVGREGDTKGEYSPIFYLKNKYELLQSGTFWLAEDPLAVGSKSWDSSLPRIATWVELKDRVNDKVFIFINTHFDHIGQEARIQSVKVIKDKLKSIASKGQSIVFTGDFNVSPENVVYQDILDSGFHDSRLLATNVFDLGYTFNAWNIEAPKTNRIDYIFNKGNDLAVWKYQELDVQRGSLFASDHYPVVVQFRWVKDLKLSPKKEHVVRVLNYNIHHGVAPYDHGEFMDINSLSHLILKNDVDIVALQEVDRNTQRIGYHTDQLKLLAERVGMYFEFGKTIDFENGEYGIAILSKYPIVEKTFSTLPTHDINQEARGILSCKIELPNTKHITVATTHLSHNNLESRTMQTEKIAALSKEKSIDFLCGDLNDVSTSKSLKPLLTQFEFDARFAHQNTIGVLQPNKKIDYILKGKKSAFKIVEQEIFVASMLSDHLLLISDIQ